MVWKIILLVYAVFVLITAACFIISHFKGKTHKNESKLWVKLLVVPLVAIGMPWILVAFFKEARYYQRPKPLEDYQLSWRDNKSYVYDWSSNEDITLDEYNKRHNTAYTLVDVYGKEYVASLSENERTIIENESKGISLSRGLPDDIYTRYAVLFSQCRADRDFSKMESIVADDVVMDVYCSDRIIGKKEFFEYWLDTERVKSISSTSVQMCNYISLPAILDVREGRQFYIIFRIQDGLIKGVTYTLRSLGNKEIPFCNLDVPPFDIKLLKDSIIEETDSKLLHLSCPRCGKTSRFLDWYHVVIDRKIHNYKEIQGFGIRTDGNPIAIMGTLSICPDCKCQVELRPESIHRIDESQLKVAERKFNSSTNTTCQDGQPSKSVAMALYFGHPLKNSKYTLNLDDEELIHNFQAEGLHLSGPDFEPMTIKQIVEEFNTAIFSQLREDTPDMINELIGCYFSAYDDGIYEAGNNLGILYYNYLHNQEEGEKWFKRAIDNGSKNAMFNYFALLWSDNPKEAVDYLAEICGRRDASIRCLYTLAVLYYYGDEIGGNPLPVDKSKALNLVEFMLQSGNRNLEEEEIEKVILNAQTLKIAIVEGANPYPVKSRSLIGYFNNIACLAAKKKTEVIDLDLVGAPFPVAPSIKHVTPINGAKLVLRLADDQTNSSGDNSYIVAQNPQGENDKAFWKHCKVDNEEMGAWEIYLLSRADTYLPSFWHGGYAHRKYIFSETDLKEIEALESFDLRNLLPYISPSAVRIDPNTIEIQCCYWNEWVGLAKEFVHIQFDGETVKDIKDVRKEVYYHYDCGIMF